MKNFCFLLILNNSFMGLSFCGDFSLFFSKQVLLTSAHKMVLPKQLSLKQDFYFISQIYSFISFPPSIHSFSLGLDRSLICQNTTNVHHFRISVKLLQILLYKLSALE